ncbi:MAG: alpha-amylase family glycosyl hydrolase, partial [Turicibacter sp.]
MQNVQERFSSYLDEYQKITVIVPKNYYDGEIAPFKLIGHHMDTYIELKVDEKYDFGHEIKYVLSVKGFIEVGKNYEVMDCYQNKSYLFLGYIARTNEFDKKFKYDKTDLGPSYSKMRTKFKIWAPTATDVELILYENPKCSLYKLHPKSKGIWEVFVEGNLDKCRYRYAITNNQVKNETLDPYAIASTENSEYSVVVDPLACVQINHDLKPKLVQPTDAIIYEVSIRDISIDESSNVLMKGQFLGLTELKNNPDTMKPTSLAYIKELGVTHIQLLPIFDFEGVDEMNPLDLYNWGYNPIQYNVPEGSYSTNPRDPYARINELRILINTLHENGLGVIMDVVYNHVFERKNHPFDAMVPTYFYRYNYQGMPSDGTGCGNDLATDRYMVRKYIIDSIKFWIEEYGIDG